MLVDDGSALPVARSQQNSLVKLYGYTMVCFAMVIGMVTFLTTLEVPVLYAVKEDNKARA